ncbi:MAG: molybdopterin-dependent oxidoreductase [Proteobacteria bacterium]|nr:molybdopterin-dependent oxidoreductase [Pseudomonadota bacterium]
MKCFMKISFLVVLFGMFSAQAFAQVEIHKYEGKALSPYDRQYDNSIKGPQTVDIGKYKLLINGKVQQPQSFTYNEILGLHSVTRAITLHCVEGWNEYLLFKGVRLVDLLKKANPNKEVQTVIFYAADGYSSSLEYKFIIKNDIMIAYEINGKRLDSERGFPLQVVAESKYGYKWVKWVTHIELSDKPYIGYWEKQGYDNEADILK